MYKYGIITSSDRGYAGECEDVSGPVLQKLVEEEGNQVIAYEILPDDREKLSAAMRRFADDLHCDIILTTGGTGFSLRDLTPEATRDVLDRLTPGLDEAMRAESMKITPHGMLSRGISGLRGTTLIINLPGSPKAAKENYLAIAGALPHAMLMLHGGDHKTAETAHK